MSATPVRTCAGCGRKAPQAEGEEAVEGGEGEEALPAEQVIAQADGDTAVEGEVAVAAPEPVEEETQPAA